LDAAVRTTAPEGYRTALTRLLLRGKPGEIVATDGRQLLIQGGFRFGWPEDVLVPRLPVFGHRDLTFTDPARLGRTASHVGLSLGPWTFLLAVPCFPQPTHFDTPGGAFCHAREYPAA
jgi:hypothetical protein